ncbi:MAG: universal stress protein [Thermoplasmata archaeon]
MFERIVVAIDGSSNADHALDAAIEIARRFNSRLTLITVVPLIVQVGAMPVPTPMTTPEDIQAFHKMLGERASRASTQGVPPVETIVVEGYVVDSILTYVEQHPQDLIVMGARGLSRAGRLFLGSTSDGIVHHAKCPVLVLHGTPPTPAP